MWAVREVRFSESLEAIRKPLKNPLLFFFFFFFLGPDIAYENSRARSHIGAAGVVYTTATATLDPNSICDLCHSLQCWILNPLREARVQTHILTDIISGS